MLFKLTILAIIITNTLAYLSTDRFCHLNEGKKCEDFNNDHSNKCGETLCSVNANECQKFLHYDERAYFLRSDFRKLHKMNSVISKLANFKSKIKKCEKYSLKENDVCLNDVSCLILLENTRNNSWLNFFSNMRKKEYSLISVKCPCKGRHSFQCGHNGYCAVDEQACDIFLQSNQKNVNICGN